MTAVFSRVQKKLIEKNLEAIIISSPYNRRYVTNFTGTSGTVFITINNAYFITDFRYVAQAKKEAIGFEIIENRDAVEEISKIVNKDKISRIAFEEEFVSFKQYWLLKEKIEGDLLPVSGIIEQFRSIKSKVEINKIKKAASIADQAFEKILDDIKPGVTEMYINHKLEMYMRELGATSSSFDLIIASGHRSSLPHGVASNKVIENRELVTLDFGVLYEGYCSDMTRTVAVGEVSDKLREIYYIVKEALSLGIKVINEGVSCITVDTVVRDFINDNNYGKYFGHGTGHSLGLEIHESPFISQKSTSVLQSGMIITIEPGIYIPDLGGVRIEDDVLVTKTGYELLTHSPKELIVL